MEYIYGEPPSVLPFPISPIVRTDIQIDGVLYGSRISLGRATGKQEVGMIGYNVNIAFPIGSQSDRIPSPSVKRDMNKRQSSSRVSRIFKGRPSGGFSLAELLVVVGVFVLLVSMTMPNYLATRPQRLLGAETNRLAAVIRQGRLFSLRDNKKVYLEFLPEIDMYRLWSAQGWRAYADVIDFTVPRNPDGGHYNGDLDGDGDYWWGTGGTPQAPQGTPEDPDVIDRGNGLEYVDTDGTYLDLDVLLMPTYPGNRPIRTISPRLRIYTDVDGTITNIARDLTDTGGVAGDSVLPLDVDLRLEYLTWDLTQTAMGTRNGVLSRFPLIYLVFFADGTLAASWDEDPGAPGSEMIDLQPGRLGAAQIFLQVRGEKFNMRAYNDFDPNTALPGDSSADAPVSPYDTLSLQQATSDVYGRVITINNLSGRVIIRNIAPNELDKQWLNVPPRIFL